MKNLDKDPRVRIGDMGDKLAKRGRLPWFNMERAQ
jgi:hypothetical protein